MHMNPRLPGGMAAGARPGRLGVTWAAIDGRADAPSGSSQYPSYFAGYSKRPPWLVAGVDYRVGINSGVTLKDPATIPWTLGVDINTASTPKAVTIQADNVVLDGYDFTLGGWWRIHLNGHSGTVIRNSKLQSFCVWGSNAAGGPFTMEYCEVDGLGTAGDTSFGTLLSIGLYPTTIRYCYFHDAQQDCVDMGMATLDARYNLFDTIGYMTGAHADGFQFAGDGTANNIKVLFNTYIHSNPATVSAPSSFIDMETQVGTAPVMNNPEMAYNVAKHHPSAPIGGAWYRIGDFFVGTVNNAYVHDNWADPANMYSFIDDRQPGPGAVITGNTTLT